MSAVVVDTDVISFLFKGDTRAARYQKHLRGKTLAISFMTVAELYRWAYVRQWGKRQTAMLEERLDSMLVIPFDLQLCQLWARICASRQKIGKPISAQDAWIAASAIRHNCSLITHNRDDFQDIPDLNVISES